MSSAIDLFNNQLTPSSPTTVNLESKPVNIAFDRFKLLKNSRMHRVHWIIVGLSLMLTLGAWYIASDQAKTSAQTRFLNAANRTVATVKDRMTLYESALLSSTALVNSNGGEIDYPHWFKYANILNIDEVYPGINGLGVIFNVKPENYAQFLAEQRDWRPDFSVHPKHTQPEYWPITFIEPQHSNSKAIGLDVAFEENRYGAILKARDLGKPQVTGPITLVQDSKSTPGFLFYVPFYLKGGHPATAEERRSNIVGVTYAPFIMNKFMQGSLESENRQVSVQVHDQGELLFDDHFKIDPNPQFKEKISIEMYGRQWDFHIATNLAFREENASYQPMYILIGGIIIDLLLLTLFWTLSKANRTALLYADQVTLELRNKTVRLEKSNKDLEQFAYVASHDLKSPLNAIDKLVCWIEEDIGEQIPETSANHLQLVRSRTNRMSLLLDDLLNYARVGRFDYEAEAVDIEQLIEDNFELLDKPAGFKLEVDSVSINVPRIPFELVMRNLISNSIKHHDREAGLIQVTFFRDGDDYQISVIDDGPGIPPKMHQRAIEMFNTLQSRDKVEGSGMGLAMAKRIVEHYQGSLDIESDGGRGTRIIISWPHAELAA